MKTNPNLNLDYSNCKCLSDRILVALRYLIVLVKRHDPTLIVDEDKIYGDYRVLRAKLAAEPTIVINPRILAIMIMWNRVHLDNEIFTNPIYPSTLCNMLNTNEGTFRVWYRRLYYLSGYGWWRGGYYNPMKPFQIK